MRRLIYSVLLLYLYTNVFISCQRSEHSQNGLRMENIVFCSKEAEKYMEYQEQPHATYKPGDTVWIYFNVKGLAYTMKENGSKESRFSIRMKLLSPKKELLFDDVIVDKIMDFEKDSKMDKIFVTVNINTTPQLGEGKYKVEFVLNDKIANKEGYATAFFYMKK